MAPFSHSGQWSVAEEWIPVAERLTEATPETKPDSTPAMGFGERVTGVAKESLKRGGNAAMLGLVDRFAPEQAIEVLPPHIQSSIGFNPLLAEEMVGVSDKALAARKGQTVHALIEDIRVNDRKIEELTPQEMSMLEEGVFSGTTSLLQMAPAIAAGVITRSPRVAAAAGAGLTGAESYGTARERGRGPGESALFGATDAVIEYATELGPFKVLGDLISGSAKKDGVTVRKITEFVVRDMLGEQAATLLQSSNAWAHGLDEELVNARDAAEIRDILGRRAGVTAIASVVAGGPQAATGAALGLARRSGESDPIDPHRDALDGDEVMGGAGHSPSPGLAPALPPPVMAVNRKGEVQPLSAVDAEIKELLEKAEALERSGDDQRAIDARSKAYGYGSESIDDAARKSIDRLEGSDESTHQPEKAPEIIPIPASQFGGMSKESLVEAAEIRGIKPGDATKAQLMDAIDRWQQGEQLSKAAPEKPPQDPSRNFLKKPLHHWVIQRGGIDPSSPIGRELRYLDIRDPGFFNRNGMKSLDGIVQGEHEIFDTLPPPDDPNGYIGEDILVDLLDQEQAGEPLLSMRQLTARQEYEIAMEQWESDQQHKAESEEEQAFQKWVVEHADEVPDLPGIDDESYQPEWEINEQRTGSSLPVSQRDDTVEQLLRQYTDDVGGGVAQYRETEKMYSSQLDRGELLAPNGEISNLSRDHWILVRTPLFKEWFGRWDTNPGRSSKVLDNNGEPLVVYHGTEKSFSRFLEEQQRYDGFFFTSSPEEAKFHAGNDGYLLASFLDIRSPYSEDAHGYQPSEWMDGRDHEQVQSARAGGHDGAIVTGTDHGSNEQVQTFVVFSPDQIRFSKILADSGKLENSKKRGGAVDETETTYQGEEKIGDSSSSHPQERDKVGFMKASRTHWGDFGDVVIQAPESEVKNHQSYPAAKSGDMNAAIELVRDVVRDEHMVPIQKMVGGRKPLVIGVLAQERTGLNAIPQAYADYLAEKLGLDTHDDVVQINVVGHTGSDGFHRLANQPLFDGDVPSGADILIVDDFVGMGGTLANLKGHIEQQDAEVIGATVLTGKPYSSKLNLSETMLRDLREKHGTEIEKWWKGRFGFDFTRLTQSEARYLFRTKDAETIRNRIIEAAQPRGGPLLSGAPPGVKASDQDNDESPSDEGLSSFGGEKNEIHETAPRYGEYEPRSLSSNRGADSLGGESPERVVRSLRRHKTSILANGVARGFIDQKHVRLIGQKIKSAEDLAILGQVYRNPAFETFRVFYTHKGKVVGQTGVTSRMPNVVQVGDISEDVVEDMGRLDADGWWLLHNHPSGNPNPSNNDKRFTNSMASRARGFKGHVVIDHNKFGVVDEKGDSMTYPLSKSAIDLFRYDVNEPSVPHNLLGYQISRPEDAAAVARSLAHDQDHYFQIVSRNINGIRGIMDVPTALLDDLKNDVEKGQVEALALLHQFARQTGGGELFAMNVPAHHAESIYSGIKEGAFLDVITTDGTSIREKWGGTPKSSSMGIQPKTIRVNEVSEEHGEYGTEDVQREQHKLISAMKKAAGKSGKGQPLDRILRSPFKLIGGIEKGGVWRPGSKGYREMERLIVESSFDKDGVFSWANPLLEQARAGLIDRYKLTDEYKQRDQRREADVRKILREGMKAVKHLADSGVSNIEEAKVLQAILTGEKIPDREWRKLSEPIRKAVNDLGEEAVQLGLISRESYQRNKGAYLHRVYRKEQGAANSIDRFFASRRKSINGNQLKGRGMRIKATMADLVRATPKNWWGRRMRHGKADPTMKGTTMVVLDKLQPSGEGTKNLPGISGEKPKGRVVERIFWPADEPIPPRFESWDHRGEWRIVDVSGEHLILWRDFTKSEREAMGEILDARYTIAKTYHQMAYDLSNGRFLRDIALNNQWARTDEPESWVEPRGVFHRTYSDVEWVLVPESVIPNSGGKKKWGALAGMYVRSEIWRDLNELDRMQHSGVWRKLMTQWKLNKTARSPVVHMNNVMSNLLFMDMADVRIQDLIHGIDAYVHRTKEYRDAEEFGAFGGGFVDQEIRRTVLEPLLEEIEQQDIAKLYGFEGKATLLGRIADGLWRRIKVLDEKGLSVYQIEDELFRMATYMRRRSMGDDVQTAAQIARDQFLNYDIRAPWVNMARNSVLPFISYTYRAVPVIAKSIAERPWKLAKYMLVSYAVNALAYALDPEGDEERERKSMREELQGKTWVGTPRMIRTPWRDDHNNPVFLDIRRWIPAGDVFDTYQSHAAFPVPAPLQFGGPAMLAGELFLNRSAFTGRNITNLKIDTPTESLFSVGSHLWKSWMPSAPWIPGSWYWDKISRSLRGARDSLMREYSLPLAILSSIGIKATPQDVEMGTRLKGREFDAIKRALDFEMHQLQRDRKREIISGEAYIKQHKLLTGKIEALRRRVKDSM